MAADSLGKSYRYLTPRERLPLLISAAQRGDAVEQQRLQASAPKVQWEAPDYCVHADAFDEAVNYHLLTLSDLAMHFWQWYGLWLARGLRNQAAKGMRGKRCASAKADREREHGAGCLVRYYAARFVAHVEGWKQFCTELHIDPQARLHFMIGWDNIVRTESRARELAFSPEDAAWFVRWETIPVDGDESRLKGPEPVETSGEVAAGWQRIWTSLIRDGEDADSGLPDAPWYGETRP
jgi:hypothetical protein